MQRSLVLLACVLALLTWQVRCEDKFGYTEDEIDVEIEGSADIPSDDEDMGDGSGSGSSITIDDKYDDEMNLFTNHYNSSATHTSVPTTEITLTKGEPEETPREENRNRKVKPPTFYDEPELGETKTSTIATISKNVVTTEEPNDKTEDVLDVKSPEEPNVASIFSSVHFMTALIVGGCVGLLFAICVIMLLAYRMRKKDEGSYALDEQKKPSSPSAYQYTQGQEYYA